MDLFNKYRRGILLSLAFGAVVFIALSFYANFNEVVQELRVFQWWLVPVVILLACCNYLLRFWKFDFYVRALDINLPKKDSLAIFVSGLIMSVSPGKFGEVLKSFLIKGVTGTPVSKSAPIVLAERFTDFVALALMSLLGLYVYKFGTGVFIISAVLIIAPLFLVSSERVCHGIINFMEKLPFFAKIAPKMKVAYASTAILLKPKSLIWTTFISIISWSFECFAFYLVCRGFPGTEVPLLGLTFAYAFSILVGALTMLPGGIGATEGSLIGFMEMSMNVVKPVAVAATFIIRACTIWFAVLLGAVTLSIYQKNISVQREAVDLAE